MQSLKGQLLVAVPSLLDPNFFQSVTLLVEHSDEGALGLILNRPTETTVGSIWEQLTDSPCPLNSPIHQGGPCHGLLSVLHSQRELASSQVLNNLYFTQEPEKIERLVDQRVEPARFYIGYAGWGPGQLEAELQEGSWLITQALTGDIFGQVDDLWSSVRQRIERANWLDTLNIRHVPQDPTLN